VVTGLDPVPNSAGVIARRDDLAELVTLFKSLGPNARKRLVEKARRYAEKNALRRAHG
jgi:hypothetical protein